MKVTVTAVCSFCAHRFDTADAALMAWLDSTEPLRAIVADDCDGRLCCDECRCDYCGAGHVTDGDREICQRGFDDHGDIGYDVDAIRDRALADRAGAI